MQVGQVGFRGMSSLNRIQSVVFDTAYSTNENLLICAPTGAGKTNIAMLTILHTIKQHIEDGVIRKDKFKVRRHFTFTSLSVSPPVFTRVFTPASNQTVCFVIPVSSSSCDACLMLHCYLTPLDKSCTCLFRLTGGVLVYSACL